MNLTEKVRDLPSTPGVYLMKDSLGSIIYVGKSKNLKSRVGSYFQNSKDHSPKVKKLVKNLKDFDFILTDTEFEAFMLECKLIKKLKPTYNRMMKNPLSYTYIKITKDKELPSMEIVNEYISDDSNLYFGPYTSKSTVERAIQGIKECYKIACSNLPKSGKACLNYSLGTCIGMCLNEKTAKKYRLIIDRVIGLLGGTDITILKEIEKMMEIASDKFDFENAAKYRDYKDAINFLINNKKIREFSEGNKTIVMTEYLDKYTIKLFIIKENEILFSDIYKIKDINQLSNTIKVNILNCLNEEVVKPLQEIGKNEIDEIHIIYNYLKNNNCRFVVISKEFINLDETINNLLQ